LPGASSRFTYVWNEGKPPRYWVVLAVMLLIFVFFWVLTIHYLSSFARVKPDPMHSVSMMEGNVVRYYPPVVIWIAYYGLFIVMAWMFILAVIMAFKRTMVPRGKR
jgi:hypothetical protein